MFPESARATEFPDSSTRILEFLTQNNLHLQLFLWDFLSLDMQQFAACAGFPLFFSTDKSVICLSIFLLVFESRYANEQFEAFVP